MSLLTAFSSNVGEVTNQLSVNSLVASNTLSDNAVIQEDLKVLNDATIEHDLMVNNDATIDHDLMVNNDATVDHDLLVNHDATIDHDLLVNHDATVDHDLLVNHDATVSHDLIVSNNAQIQELAVLGSAGVSQNLTVTGTAQCALLNVTGMGSFLNGTQFILSGSKPATRTTGAGLVQGDRWYNPSTGYDWFWNGTYWVSCQRFSFSIAGAFNTQFIDTNVANNDISQNIRVHAIAGYDLIDVSSSYLVYSFGTVFDSTNYLTFQSSINVQSQVAPPNDSVTYLSTNTITLNSNAALLVNQHQSLVFTFPGKITIAQPGLMNLLNFIVTTVGSPSTTGMLSATLNYRIVAP